MNKNTLLFAFFCVLMATHNIMAQDAWIDKNENESYVERHECSFVQSGNKFIMFGGREQAQRVDIYDYTNDSWSQGTQAPEEFNHFQALEYDGLIWIIGAFKTNSFPNEAPADAISIYNPALDIWIEGPEIPVGRRRGGAGLAMYNDKFYLIAGNTQGHNGGYIPWFDVYDPLQNTWQQLADAPRSRDHFSAAIIGDKIYAASGRLSGGSEGVFAPLIPEVDVYDLIQNSWSTLTNGDIPTPRAGASVVTFGGELFVIGGEGTDPGPAFKTVEAYNPSTNAWGTKADLNYARHGTQAIVSGQGIHIAGGSPTRGGGRMRNMEVYQVDAPIGSSIQESSLSAPNEVIIDASQAEDVPITSSGGNAGNFITNVAITGVDASSFILQNTLLKHLIKSNTAQNITIAVAPEAENKTATLEITYDDGKILIINLMSATTLRTANYTPSATNIKLVPNPFKNNQAAYLSIHAQKKSTAYITTYDINGALIMKTKHHISNGHNTIDLTALKNTLSNGMYILKYETDTMSKQLKLIINN